MITINDYNMSKAKKEPSSATRANLTKEMEKPRMAKSARIAELNLDTARIREQPSVTMPGTVHKVIPSVRAAQPDKAQIAVDEADHAYRDLRIENTLTDEHGDGVSLKKGLTFRLPSQRNRRQLRACSKEHLKV
jgi:hypothetical protein